MFISGLAFLVTAMVVLVLGLAGVIHGAAGLINILLMASFALLAGRAVMSRLHRNRHHHH